MSTDQSTAATPDNARRVTLRPAGPEDMDFLRRVYASTRAEELALTNWDEAQRAAFINHQFIAQHQYYHTEFPEAAYEIILLDGEPIGRRYVLRDGPQMRILDITLLPEHRGAGIGTALMRELMEEAAQTGRHLRIYVENFNRSQSLFARLGFVVVEEDGFLWLWEWRSKENSRGNAA